jgi:hypothetical protein
MDLKSSSIVKSLLDIRFFYLFLGIIALQYIFLFVNTNFILADGNSYNSLKEIYSIDGVEKDEKSNISIIILNYLFPWVLFSVKFIVISLTLVAGFLLAGIKNIKLLYVFKIVIIAELIFFIRSFYRLYYFGIVEPNFTIEDYQSYTPLSVKNIFIDAVPREFHYILSLINIYEVFYVVILSLLFCKVLYGVKNMKIISSVSLSYFSLIIFWSLFITLINILNT